MLEFQRNGHNASILVRRAGNACATIQPANGSWAIEQHGAALEKRGNVRSAGLRQNLSAFEFSNGALNFWEQAVNLNYDSLQAAMQALIDADPATDSYDCSSDARALLVSFAKHESPRLLTTKDIELAKAAWKPKKASPNFTPAWA